MNDIDDIFMWIGVVSTVYWAIKAFFMIKNLVEKGLEMWYDE